MEAQRASISGGTFATCHPVTPGTTLQALAVRGVGAGVWMMLRGEGGVEGGDRAV